MSRHLVKKVLSSQFDFFFLNLGLLKAAGIQEETRTEELRKRPDFSRPVSRGNWNPKTGATRPRLLYRAVTYSPTRPSRLPTMREEPTKEM